MRERLLAVGADLSRVYVCSASGYLASGVSSASVFHWHDLDERGRELVDGGGVLAGAVAARAGVSVADLLAAWQWVERLRASMGDGFQLFDESATCPVCGGVDVSGWEFEAEDTQAWQEVSCDDCGSRWNDVYVMAGRAEIVRGDRAPRVAVPSEPGPADHLDAAYEDANGCGVEQ